MDKDKTQCKHSYDAMVSTYAFTGYGQSRTGAQTIKERCTVCGKRRELTDAQYRAGARLTGKA